MTTKTKNSSDLEPNKASHQCESNEAGINLVKGAYQLHIKCEEHGLIQMQYARDCGEKLIEARTHVKHGSWLEWINDHFDGKDRKAQQYMQIARTCREKPNLLSDECLSVNQTIKLIREAEKRKSVVTSDITSQFRDEIDSWSEEDKEYLSVYFQTVFLRYLRRFRRQVSPYAQLLTDLSEIEADGFGKPTKKQREDRRGILNRIKAIKPRHELSRFECFFLRDAGVITRRRKD
jgi:hypothetical protein